VIKPLEYVAKIKPYIPGKPIEELEREIGIKGSVKLASNENPFGPSSKALEALKEFLNNPYGISRYPDDSGYYLKNALCEKNSDIGHDNIILGNGSNTLIDIAVRTFMGPGDEAVMANPSFVSYPIAVTAVGGMPVEMPLVDYRHDLIKMSEAITKRTKMVFIANPNNPTGTIVKRDEFDRFMNRVPDGVLVVVDEAYYEYVNDLDYPDAAKYFMDGRDILILRTFSKVYGLAGLRIGYGVAKKDIISEMNKIRGPFNVNSMAQISAIHALTDNEHIKKSIDINEQGKQFLYRELNSIGIRYVPTYANFIFIPLDVESKIVYDALLRNGVIVRPVGQKEIRVTIGLPDENKRFVEALKIALSLYPNPAITA
jgi:histidinol-phosphate aminotransferase